MSDDTSTASFEVLEVMRLEGRGRLIAFAQVEVTLDSVPIMTQGWRVLRRSDGLSTVEPPCYRHADGDLVPAIVLPEELEDAIARSVLKAMAPGSMTVTVRPKVCTHIGAEPEP